MGATLEEATNKAIKDVVDAINREVNAIEAKLDDDTYGLSALTVDLDTLLTRLTAARAGYLDNIPVTEIENESVWTATAGVPLIANQEYPILEVLVAGGVIYVYRYNFATGTVPAVPTETLGRTEITNFAGDVFELSKLFININKATTGLFPRMGAADVAHIYAKYWDTTAGAFVLVPDIVRRDKAVDTLISSPPISTDVGEGIVFDGAKLQLASRFIIYFYNDANITSEVNIPFTFGIRRAR